MLKAIEQNNKLKRAIILSIALHCILITVLIWSSIHQPQEIRAGGYESSIDAVMVDPDTMLHRYNRQQQIKELLQKQEIDQQRLKALKKHYPAVQEADKAQQCQQTERQKQAEETKKKTKTNTGATKVKVETKLDTAETKKQIDAEAKKTATDEAKKQASAKAQVEQGIVQEKTNTKTDQAAKKKVTAKKKAAKQSSNVDTLLDSLTDAKSVFKASACDTLEEPGKTKQSSADVAEIDAYKIQVSQAISKKFYDASSYRGRVCDLRIKLELNGLLISVTAVGGDQALCQAAISAVKLATIPRPPNPQIYDVFKNIMLRFSPK